VVHDAALAIADLAHQRVQHVPRDVLVPQRRCRAHDQLSVEDLVALAVDRLGDAQDVVVRPGLLLRANRHRSNIVARPESMKQATRKPLDSGN
jgi:hypothetical protein